LPGHPGERRKSFYNIDDKKVNVTDKRGQFARSFIQKVTLNIAKLKIYPVPRVGQDKRSSFFARISRRKKKKVL
jgi:hypothetical protein